MVMSQEVERSFEQPLLLRPWLQLACFCEKVLREQDSVLSLIRIVDCWSFTGNSREMSPQVIRCFLVFGFKAGSMRGRLPLKLQAHSPSFKELPATTLPLLFEGDDARGAYSVLELNITVDEEGVYWWDVRLEDEIITKVPMKVVYRQMPTVSGSG
jgi:hypothetical protein